jgi:hypothetical protein
VLAGEAMGVCEDGGAVGRDGDGDGDGPEVHDELQVLRGNQLAKIRVRARVEAPYSHPARPSS